MHVEHRKVQRCQSFIPAFSRNDEQLRHVLALMAFRYANGGGKQKEYFHLFERNLPELERQVEAKFQEWQARRLDTLPVPEKRKYRRHLYIVDAFGWLGLHAAIAYRSWRLGQSSTQVASQLFMSAPGVRIALWRMNNCARALGYETFMRRAYQSKGKRRQAHVTKLPPGPKLLRLAAKTYWTQRRLAARYGVRAISVQVAIRNAKQKRNSR